jgi:ABC-type antimicrobial peptide transport system permease subunit
MAQSKLIEDSNWAWLQIWVRLSPGASAVQVTERLQTTFSAFRSERVKASKQEQTKKQTDEYVGAALSLAPARSGLSFLQRQYRQSLLILGAIAALVLLIACANVANLMSAQAAARAREMALRVSIGAGRARLVQLVIVESALIAVAAMTVGGLFAWWSAPFVVSQLNPPDNPVELILSVDWRVMGFAAALTLGITILFGLGPALRASAAGG